MRMIASRARKGMAIVSMSVLLLLFPLALTASAAVRDYVPVSRVATYRYAHWHGHVWGGRYWGPWGWGGWGWSPYWDGYYYQPATGKIKLEHVNGTDQVYLDGSYAGKAGDLKTMTLMAGSYNLEIKNNGRDVLKDHVYVTLGRTLKLNVGDEDRVG